MEKKIKKYYDEFDKQVKKSKNPVIYYIALIFLGMIILAFIKTLFWIGLIGGVCYLIYKNEKKKTKKVVKKQTKD